MRFRTFVLDLPREVLVERIDRRVEAMLHAGLLDEVRSLREAGYGAGDPGMNATGYVELLPVLEGRISLAEAAEQVRRNTRAYARRQQTWLRHQLPSGAIRLDATRPAGELADEIARDWRTTAAREVPGAAGRTPPAMDDTQRQNAE